MRKKKSKIMKSKLVAAWYKNLTEVQLRRLDFVESGILLPPIGSFLKKLIAMYAKEDIKTKKTK